MFENILEKSNIKVNEPMSKHTSFKVGGNADYFVKAQTVEQVVNVKKYAEENNIPLYVIGNGSNILVTDRGIRGIVLKIDLQKIEINEEEVTVGAGVKVMALAQKLLSEELTGFEELSGIPGTIGGAIRMNAGAYGKEIKDICIQTTYLDENNNIKILKNNEQDFSYRHSIFEDKKYIILETKLKLEKGKKEEIKGKMEELSAERKEKQPWEYPSAGSTFKRKEGVITAKLIDECGLKGHSIGGAEVSEKHAGFVINKGNATAKDILDLIEYIKKNVYEKFNIEIEEEIEIIGER